MDATFVPPPVPEMQQALDNLEDELQPETSALAQSEP